MTPELSIVCTSYNRKELTARWLCNIEQCWPGMSTQLIIVDDHSTDGTREMLDEYVSKHKNIEVIYKSGNSGFSDTCRIGQMRARGNWVLVTQNDVMYSKGSIDRLIEVFIELEEKIPNLGCIGIAGGMIKDFKVSEDMSSWNGDGVTGYQRKRLFDHVIVDYLDGFLMLYRGNEARRRGIYFDPRYRFYWEDVDLCYQFKSHGMCSVMVSIDGNGIPPIHHIRNQTIMKLVPEYKKIIADMEKVFKSKWYG